MRFAIVSVLVACTGAAKREGKGLPYRYVPPAPPELPDGCTGGPNNQLTIGPELGSDPPVIVLDDDFLPCAGQDPPRPRVAIWRDGTIVFARAGVLAGERIQELVQGTIPPIEVNKLIEDVADAVEHSPRRFDTGEYSLGGQTSLVVWNHGHWRAAIVDGAFPDDFIRAGTPPTPFAQAYKELLDARPADGSAITRDELSVTFFPLRVLGGEAVAHKRLEIAWPGELPQPPADVDPCADDVECVRDIAPAHRGLADQLRQEIHRSSFDVEFTAHGQHFLSRFDSHYHGERGIQQLERCAAHLGASR